MLLHKLCKFKCIVKGSHGMALTDDVPLCCHLPSRTLVYSFFLLHSLSLEHLLRISQCPVCQRGTDKEITQRVAIYYDQDTRSAAVTIHS